MHIVEQSLGIIGPKLGFAPETPNFWGNVDGLFRRKKLIDSLEDQGFDCEEILSFRLMRKGLDKDLLMKLLESVEDPNGSRFTILCDEIGKNSPRKKKYIFKIYGTRDHGGLVIEDKDDPNKLNFCIAKMTLRSKGLKMKAYSEWGRFFAEKLFNELNVEQDELKK